jgi:hypothetical protein
MCCESCFFPKMCCQSCFFPRMCCQSCFFPECFWKPLIRYA